MSVRLQEKTPVHKNEARLIEEVDRIIAQYRTHRGSLIQILHLVQEAYGYLPTEVQKRIAVALDLPLSEVSGVVTFYSFFSDKPRGLHTIRVCLGTACYVRGGRKIVEALMRTLQVELGETTSDGRFTFEVARCIGACGLAPALMIDGEVYKQVRANKLDAILAKYANG